MTEASEISKNNDVKLLEPLKNDSKTGKRKNEKTLNDIAPQLF